MTITVSISQFRQNISEYINQVQAGNIVILKDQKKGETLAKVIGEKKFNPETFGKALTRAAGVFTAKNHPEWRTKKDVMKWVHEGRMAAERKF